MLGAHSVPAELNAKAPTSGTQNLAEVKTDRELKSEQLTAVAED